MPFSVRKGIGLLSGFLFIFALPCSAAPLPWIEYSVRSGESLAFIAGRYGVSPKTIERANELSSREEPLPAGEKILIPRGESQLITTLAETRARQRGETLLPLLKQEEKITLPTPVQIKKAPSAVSEKAFLRPLDGRISSPYGRRRGRLHDGVDIPAPKGTAIRAARSGKVVFSGVIRGFGKTVTIDHGDGMVTRYSHNSANIVKKGTWVQQGQTIAKVGRTGRTTCCHRHFSVILKGKTVNPVKYFP